MSALAEALAHPGARAYARIDEALRQISLGIKSVDDLLDDDLFWLETESDLKAMLDPMAKQLIVQSYTHAAGSLKLDFDFAMINAEAQAYAAAYTNAWWQTFSTSTQDFMRQAVLDFGTGDIATLPDLTKRLQGAFSPARAESIAQTETTRIYAEGNLRAFQDAKVITVHFNTVGGFAAGADAVCVEAESKNPYPIGLVPKPPLHVRCLTGDTLVSPGSRIAAVFEREYRGEIVVVRTARGHRLSVTPNHPVLTPGGWLPAGSLYVGDHVISSLREQWALAGNEHDEHVPTRIEEVARAFGKGAGVRTGEMPVTAPDFHGDGLGSKVAVIRADRLLWDRRQPALPEHLRQRVLAGARADEGAFVVLRSSGFGFGGVRAPASGGMGRGDLVLAGRGRHSSPLEALSVAPPAAGYSVQGKKVLDRHAGDAEPVRYGVLGLPGDVAPDEVVEIERAAYSGHVYNLETESGFYTGGGIIVHNCRCFLTPGEVEQAAVAPQAPKPKKQPAAAAGSPVQPQPKPLKGSLGRTQARANYAQMERARNWMAKPRGNYSPNAAGEAKDTIMRELAERIAADPQKWESFSQFIYEQERNFNLPGGKGITPTTQADWARKGSRVRQINADPATYADLKASTIYDVNNDLIREWAGTSGDNSIMSVALQIAARDEFGLAITDSALEAMYVAQRGGQAFSSAMQAMANPAYSDFYRTFLRTMYEHTQDAFAAEGITHLNLVRGMGFSDVYGGLPAWAQPVRGTRGNIGMVNSFDTIELTDFYDAAVTTGQIDLSPMNSFSSNYSTASNFGHGDYTVALYGEVPVGRIIGTARTGYGCLNEWEFVVLNGEGELFIFSRRGPIAAAP